MESPKTTALESEQSGTLVVTDPTDEILSELRAIRQLLERFASQLCDSKTGLGTVGQARSA